MARGKSRGRPRKAAAVRTKSGRISRAQSSYNENADGIELRMRVFGLSEKDARDQKAGTVHGRLQLKGSISQAQYDAAEELFRLYDAYLRALRAPDALKSTGTGGNGISETEAYAAWCRSVIDKYERAKRAILYENAVVEHRGCNLLAAVDYILFRQEDHPYMHGDFRIAMNAVSHHMGLTETAKQFIRG